MRIVKLTTLAFAITITAYSIESKKEIASIAKINNDLAIIFKETCEVSAISLDDESGNSISEIVYSETPGGGPILKK